MTISVIIPCYNGWKYFEKCLDSLNNQIEPIDEIIIVDDCSTDDTYVRLQKFAKESSLNIKLLKNSINLGPGKSREYGIMQVTSDYVAFCDCDDWYERTFIRDVKIELKKIYQIF